MQLRGTKYIHNAQPSAASTSRQKRRCWSLARLGGEKGAGAAQEVDRRPLSCTLGGPEPRPRSRAPGLGQGGVGGRRGVGRGHASGLRSLGRLAAEQEPTCCVCTNSGRAGGGQSRPRVGWAPRPPGGREPRSSGLKLPTYPQGNYREQPGGVCEEHIHSRAWVKEASYWQLKAPQKCRARCWTPWPSPGRHRALSAASPLPSTKQPLPPSRTHQPTLRPPGIPAWNLSPEPSSPSPPFPARPLPTL